MDPERYYELQTELYCRLIGPEWHLGYWADAANLQDAISDLTQLMASRLDLTAGARLLDVGCGVGGAARALAARFRCAIVGVSNSRSGLAAAARATKEHGLDGLVGFEFAEATDLPFADGSFDAVWSCEAIHNVIDHDKALSEICRVLKPGGAIVVGDLFQLREPAPNQPITHGLEQWGFHLRTSREWTDALTRNGIEVHEAINIGPQVAPSLAECTRLFSAETGNLDTGSAERVICERTALATTALAGHFASGEIGWGIWSGAKHHTQK